jgi:hypothetical protein
VVSSTRYSRPHVLRMSERERHLVTQAVMARIVALQTLPDTAAADLVGLRGLLEQLTD